jgi:hypothetical protein
VRAVRRTCRVVTLGATPGHIASRHAAQGCAGSHAGGTSHGNADSHAGAALPTLAQAVPGQADRRPRRARASRTRARGQTTPRREHGEPRQDAARQTGPRWATCAPRQGPGCARARPSRAAPGRTERRGRARPGGVRGGGGVPRHAAPCRGQAAPRSCKLRATSEVGAMDEERGKKKGVGRGSPWVDDGEPRCSDGDGRGGAGTGIRGKRKPYGKEGGRWVRTSR